MQQETIFPSQTQEEKIPSEQSLTNINEIIAEIAPLESNTNYESYVNILKSIFKLSQYLFIKKHNKDCESPDESFDNYLNSFEGMPSFRRQQKVQELSEEDETDISDALNQLKFKIRSFKNKHYLPQSSLVKCYEKVPYIFFETNFVLDFNILSKNSSSLLQTIEDLNQNLDLVEINLFSQIHRKFHQYFQVVANFDYLRQSVQTRIANVQSIRNIIQKSKHDFVDKSIKLRHLIPVKQNIQKLLKTIKIIKSLKKLPSVIESILQSSLPYECLSLLQSTKASLKNVSGLMCISKIEEITRECSNTISNSLSKRYCDQIFDYLFRQCQVIKFREKWEGIKIKRSHDDSMNMSGYMEGQNSMVLEQCSFVDRQKTIPSKGFILKKQQGRQFEISMILIQSYKYIQFPVQQNRIQITNYLRVFTKTYEQQLASYLSSLNESHSQNNREVLKQADEEKQQNSERPRDQNIEDPHEQKLNQQLISGFSVESYVRHLTLLNNIYEQVLNRYLGFLYTLVTEYEEAKEMQKANSTTKINQERFRKLFEQKLSLFSVIYNIITQKIKSLLVLKNLSGARYKQFNEWLMALSFWEKYIDNVIEEHPLAAYSGILSDLVETGIKKTLIIYTTLKNTIHQLTIKYINNYHENILLNQLKPALEDDSWQSVEIPRQFQDILLNIVSKEKEGTLNNISISSLTILNQSQSKPEEPEVYKQKQGVNLVNIKVLKNTLLIEGQRYKITLSFLLVCQFIDEYIKIFRLFLHQRNYILQKLVQMIQYYCALTNKLILMAQALKYQKIKSKNITAKHMCLLSNCLSVLKFIVMQISSPLFQKVLQCLDSNKAELHKKLSNLLLGKTQVSVNNQISGNNGVSISQTNKSILSAFLPMFQIIDDYLDPQSSKQIFCQSIKFFMQKYFPYMIQSEQGKSEAKVMLINMRSLRPKFQSQFLTMEKEIDKLT